MLDGLKREISNWYKGREKDRERDIWLYLGEEDRVNAVIQSLDGVALRNVKRKVFIKPQDLEGIFSEEVRKIIEEENINTHGFIQERLRALLKVDVTDEPERHVFNLHLEVYAGTEDERQYIDAYCRIGHHRLGWTKVWTLGYTLPLT